MTKLIISFLVLVLVSLVTIQGITKPVYLSSSSCENSLKSPLLAPRYHFSHSPEEYTKIDNASLWQLSSSNGALSLPNLSEELLFYGFSERPDFQGVVALIGLKSGGEVRAITEGQRLPLVFQADESGGRYLFGKAANSLWLEFHTGKSPFIEVIMIDKSGQKVLNPQEFRDLPLEGLPKAKIGSPSWHLGPYKVEGSLLVKQKAKWYGEDLFIKHHGGSELREFVGAHRLDFEESGTPYSCFVKEGSMLAWHEGKWHPVLPNYSTNAASLVSMVSSQPLTSSHHLPLLYVKKIDERVMHLEIWDAEGKAHQNLNLIKSHEPPLTHLNKDTFRCSKGFAQGMLSLETSQGRLFVEKGDWIIFHRGRWQKITSNALLDQYLLRKTIGEMAIIDEVGQGDGSSVLIHFLSSSRASMVSLSLPIKENSLRLKQEPENRLESLTSNLSIPNLNDNLQEGWDVPSAMELDFDDADGDLE